MKLKELLQRVRYEEIFGDENTEITDVCADSRHACKGSLFVCLKGENCDGHEYAENAVKNGAVALVVERKLPLPVTQVAVSNSRKALSVIAAAKYGYPSDSLKIIGVTGTNGKTTTAHMLAAVLSHSGKKVGITGTLGAKFENRTMSCELTTPDPIYMNYIFSEMVKSGIEYCVSEISAHALYYDKDYAINYEAVIFTNLTRDHLDFFGNMQNYADAKKKLFFERRSKYSVINVDDEFGRKLAFDTPNAVTYGIKSPSDVFSVIEEETVDGSVALINLCDELCECEINVLGEFNVYNAMAAVACAWKMGISVFNIADGIYDFKGVKGRIEKAGEINGAYIFVDYAHTPDGLLKTLSALKKVCEGKLYCLFGCGGNRDQGKRKIMGETASYLSDFVIITSDNPRFEDSVEIIKEIESGIVDGKDYVCIEKREDAICYGIKSLNTGDVLLIAGKGAETYQEIMGIKYDYSDYNVIKKLIG